MGVDDRYKVHIRVNRPIYTQQDFNQKYTNNESLTNEPERMDKKHSLLAVFNGPLHHIKSRCSLPSAGCIKKRLLSFLPFIEIMKSYNVRADLPSDIMSGLIVGIMHIPQGRYTVAIMKVRICMLTDYTKLVLRVLRILNLDRHMFMGESVFIKLDSVIFDELFD